MQNIIVILFSLLLFDTNASNFESTNSTHAVHPQNSGIFTDDRDCQTYKWVRLKDGKKWMVQNLNFEMDGSWCYDNNSDRCAEYGRLYIRQAAQTACPSGWRLPTDEEWWQMASYYGKAFSVFTNREEGAGQMAYKTLAKGGDSEFSAVLGGLRFPSGTYINMDINGSYWSSTEKNASVSRSYRFNSENKRLAKSNTGKKLAISCRCLQD